MRFFSTLFCCAWFFGVNAQQVVINEVVTHPVLDYSTSNYSETTSEVNVTDVDEWLELLILDDGLDLSSWTIELLDGTDVIGNLSDTGAFQTSKYISSSGGTFIDTDSGDFLVLGNVRGNESMSNTITIRLRDPLDNIVDAVTLSSDPNTAPLGNSSSVLDESVCRIPDGRDTNQDANDFIETVATPGTANSKKGKVMINELVTETIRDWSAANYTFRADSVGTFSDIDEWVELYISEDKLNLARWQIELSSTDDVIGDLSDTGAFQFSKYISNTEGSSFYKTAKGDYLLLANVKGSARQLLNTGYFTLKNAFGETVDQVRLGFDQAPNGNSTTMSNESVARLPNASDTDNDALDFIETFATPGFKNVYGKIDRYREKALVLAEDSVRITCLKDSLQQNFTFSLWLKPQVSSSEQKILQTVSGIDMLVLKSDQTLSSSITGATITSADTLSTTNWNHVVLQKQGNQFLLFLNGKQANSWTGSFSFTSDTIVVGPLTANLEEFQVWKTALNESEIRSQMRLTQSGENEALLHYFQFNNLIALEPLTGSEIKYSNSILEESEAPISYGVSNSFLVNSSGAYFSASTVPNHNLQLSFSGTLPNGEVVVSFIEETPNLKPKGFTYNDGVWIVDNYGNNLGLNATMLFDFPEDYLTTTDTATYFLYKRNSNAVGDWEEYKSVADTVILTSSERQVQFSEIESFSQFLVAANVSPLPVQFLDFYFITEEEIQLQWQFASPLTIKEYQIFKGNNPDSSRIIGSTTNNYFEDVISTAINYYRIDAIDFSGHKTSSKTIVWVPSKESNSIKIYPIPSVNMLNVEAENLSEIELINAEGQSVYYKLLSNTHSYRIDVTPLKAGVYVLKIIQNGKQVRKKILLRK